MRDRAANVNVRKRRGRLGRHDGRYEKAQRCGNGYGGVLGALLRHDPRSIRVSLTEANTARVRCLATISEQPCTGRRCIFKFLKSVIPNGMMPAW